MKLIYNLSRIFLLTACFSMLLTSCKDELPEAIDSSAKLTELKSIKIINAGANGNIILEGTVSEETKTIRFPRIDPETNFSNLKFEAITSDGSTLDKDAYSITFEEGVTQKSIVIKVINQPRYREYLATFRLKVPVYGADFENGSIYDYSNNAIGNPIYSTYVSQATRGGAFNGEFVLVPSRQGGINPHLLKVSDLKEGKIEKINLNTSGITGGTLHLQSAAFSGDNLYLFNLSDASGFKMYFYRNFKSNLNATPEVVTVSSTGLEGTTNSRFGENTSLNLDANGNGYIFMPNNPYQRVLRLKIENFTSVVDRTIIQMPGTAFTFGVSYNQIGGTSEYLATSYNSLLYLMNESGGVIHSVPSTIFETSAADARVIYFNEERYLMYMTAGINNTSVTVLKVYDITRGNSISEALTLFAAQTELARKPVLEFALNGAPNSAPITRTSWVVEKDNEGNDNKLLLFATATDAGFTILEFSKKVAED